MKRVIALVTAGIMTCGLLAGCGSSSASSTTGSTAATSKAASTATSSTSSADSSKATSEASSKTSSTTATSTSAGGSYNMTLIMSTRDEFLSSLEEAATSKAKEDGISLSIQDAQNDNSKMIQFIETAKNAGNDAVIVNPVDSESCAEYIVAAGDMKVVFVNRMPSDLSVLTDNCAVVSSDETQSGKFQGEYLAEYFKKAGKTDIKYIMLSGALGQYAQIHRTESVLKALEDNGIKATAAVEPLACDWDRATAQDQISPLISTTEFDCIISNNDAMALGAIEALVTSGKDPSSLPIVGVDATADGCAAVEAGTLAMTVFQDPVGQGAGSLMAAKNLLNGKALNDGMDYELSEDNNKIVWIPFEEVTKDNVADYINK